MVQKSLTFFLLLVAVNSSLAQNALPPEYLMKQDFTDSVKNLQLLKLSGEKIDVSQLLKEYKGKKIVIDFWASWCRDCIDGLPKLEELKHKTGQTKVAYVFISVDHLDWKWRTAISRFNITGDHYRIEKGWHNSFSNYIELDWVPRYLVLNEDGRVIVAKAIAADNGELKKSLSE